VQPLRLAIDSRQAWDAVVDAVSSLARTRIVAHSDTYLHAECRSAVFGFVDDLELQLRPDENLISVRSASRLGYSDFGVNRRRVERLRAILANQNIVS